jgi:DNA processing protein
MRMDWQAEYDQLRREVANYSAELARTPHCVVFTKLDLWGEEYVPEIEAPEAFGLFSISAPARQGLDALKSAWWSKLLEMLRAAELPGCLGDLSHRVAGLWCLGEVACLSGAPDRLVSIVGTRDCSAYAERTAARLAAACVRAGLVVVSGLARGVDAAAHRGAMHAGGRTIAVLGTGVDVPYPVGHRALHAEVQRAGLVVSEMEPGTRAGPGCFPRRNRIIAALARYTVVVEAGFKSGAMNTAGQALQLGRGVAAVPGMIDDPRTAGSNLLIRDGAHAIASVEDVLGLYGLSTSDGGSEAEPRVPGADYLREALGSFGASITPEDRNLALLVARGSADLEALAFTAGMSVRQVSERLLRLEMAGMIRREGVGYSVAP